MNIFWFRRDLRLNDNHGLFKALENGITHPIFIFDKNILDKLPKNDKRVSFINDTLQDLKSQLNNYNSDLDIYFDEPINVFKTLINKYKITAIYTNHDYEPYAISRDNQIARFLSDNNVEFHTFKDQVIFEKDEVLKDNGAPYTVFTPYSKKWLNNFNSYSLPRFDASKLLTNLHHFNSTITSLDDLEFIYNSYDIPEPNLDLTILNNYHNTRDIPSIRGTSRLSIHLRFGTISIRELVKEATNKTYLNELIWREFYMMILWHFPHVVTRSFKPKYDTIQWRNDPNEIQAWMDGTTGYPIVDAGMRELNITGYMHNRVRMITASFLTKHLLVDWRIGEAYFAEKLLDFELASNNGGWQWAAGSGCDAAPYFRVFNPELQTKKFDPELKYIRKWVPEFDNPFDYPKPIVDHKFARERALATYKDALK